MPDKIAIFESAREVIRAEKLCRDHDIQATVMPVPELLSSECGMCLHIADSLCERFAKLIEENNINVTIYSNDR